MNKQKKRQLMEIVAFGILLYCGILHLNIIWNVLVEILSLFLPFILGGAIAFILNVPMKQIEQRLFTKNQKWQSLKRLIAFIITLILVLGVLALALIIIIPELIDTGKILGRQIPIAVQSIENWLKQNKSTWPSLAAVIDSSEFDFSAISQKTVSLIQSAGAGILSSGFNIISGIISGIVSFFIGFVFSVYILFRKERLSKQLRQVLFAFLSEKKAKTILKTGQLANKTFSSFLSGQCLEACILGTLFFIAMSILRLPYAMLIGVIIAITALIPIIGAFIGCLVGAFLIVMVNPIQALWFLILFLILQQVEGNLIYPRVVGNSVGLPSMWVLVAVSVGGSLFGILGILVFIPLSSVCYALFREFILKRLKKKKIDL